jgi:hypothetical protein
MAQTFTETLPIESGFAAVYRARIAPRLQELDTTRRDILATAKRHAAIAVGAGAVLGLIFVLSGGGFGDISGSVAGFLIPLAFGVGIAVLLWKRQARRWSGSAAQTVMPEICAFIGDLSFDHEALRGFPLERMQKLGVIRPFTRSEVSNRLEGRYRDTPFEIVAAELFSRNKESATPEGGSSGSVRTLFRGLLMRIGVPEPIPTRILIARDYGMGNKLASMFAKSSGRKMPKVDTGHAAFERDFEVYSPDPELARKVLAPGFLDSFVELAKAEGGQRGAEGIEAGFHDESFFLALKRDDDFLKISKLSAPVDDIEDELHGVFTDLATVQRIIDRLHGDHPA